MASSAAAAAAATGAGAEALPAAARARMERSRLRARELRDARLVRRAPLAPAPAPQDGPQAERALDSGGGFLLELPAAAPAPAAPAQHAPAPLVHASEQPRCDECGRRFPQSYLFDTFDCSVCDECRQADGAHALVTRTEAKSEFLLQDCDLDVRPPALRCVSRRNPHRGAAHDMRLYLRAQVEARALLAWGSLAALEAERARRRERAERARAAAAARRLRDLRLAARSSLLRGAAPAHAHRWGAEREPPDGDGEYSRECLDCGHTETYEKM